MTTASAPPAPDVPETPLQRLITCCICEELFDLQRHQPKMLPCQHTVCLRCLRDMLSSRTEAEETMDCPLCRRVTDIPDSGAVGFPPNMTMMHIILDKIKLTDTYNIYNKSPDSGLSCSAHGDTQSSGSVTNNSRKIRIKKLAAAHLMAFDFMDINSSGEVIMASNDYSYIKMKLRRNKYQVYPQESEGAEESRQFGELTSVLFSNDDQLIFQTCSHIAYINPNGQEKKSYIPYSGGTLLHVHNKSRFWYSGYLYQWFVYCNKTSSGFAVRVYSVQDDKHFTLVLTGSRPMISTSRRHFTILDGENGICWLFAANKGLFTSEKRVLDQVVLSPKPADITSSALIGNYLLATETWNYITSYNLTTGERGPGIGKEELGIERGQPIQKIWTTADSVLHVVYGTAGNKFLSSYVIQL